MWTWVAIDADTKLVPSWLVGERTLADAFTFIDDLGSRLKGDFQLTTDGLNLYLNTVDAIHGERIDYAILHKLYGAGSEDEQRRYSPAKCIGVEGRPVIGNPDPDKISTSNVERQNLTMRMGCDGSPASPTASPRRWRTWRTPSASITCTTTLLAPI